jgi:error-prone DNA polymerase
MHSLDQLVPQPTVFYPMETLKQDARRFGVPVLNPCVNRSRAKCAPETGDVQLILWPSVLRAAAESWAARW